MATRGLARRYILLAVYDFPGDFYNMKALYSMQTHRE